MIRIFTYTQLTPDPLEESRRELDRQLERKRQIREASAARRAAHPPRFATLAARLRQAVQPHSFPPHRPEAPCRQVSPIT